MVGLHAPSFSRPSINGGAALSSEATKGKVLVVDFWATYCKPCEKEFPKLQALADAHKGAVVVYALSEDDAPEGIAAFVKKTGVKFPIGWDDGNSISQRYKLDKMPTSYIVDKKGIIRFVHGGYGEGEELAMSGRWASCFAESSTQLAHVARGLTSHAACPDTCTNVPPILQKTLPTSCAKRLLP